MTGTATDQIERLIAQTMGLDAVKSSDRLVEDLGVESVDLVNIVATIEERFHIQVPEQQLPALRTVSDLTALLAGNPRLS